jgi:16S rRNA (cytidine1402-2'-O)-methyltransferase
VVIVVAGAAARAVAFPDAVAQVVALVAGGVRRKDAAAEVSQVTGHSSRELYQASLSARD